MTFNQLCAFILVLCLYLIFSTTVESQSLTIHGLQSEQIQIQELLNSEGIGSVNRPYSLFTYRNAVRNRNSEAGWWNRNLNASRIELPGNIEFGVYPFRLQNTLNSSLPMAENNEAAWYGSGSNTEFRGGLWITSDYFTFSIQPHLVWQQNKDFSYPRRVLRDGDGNVRYIAERTGAELRIDAPFRFGPDPYWTYDWSYSSARVHYKELELGVSTEPLWWGPGHRNALSMSNNAPGFPQV